ncbi:hypothetical protein WJX77_011887 [Trebouxia sp. C0004]
MVTVKSKTAKAAKSDEEDAATKSCGGLSFVLVAGAAPRATPSITSRLQTKQCVMGLSDYFLGILLKRWNML